jgi:hypothetical protein
VDPDNLLAMRRATETIAALEAIEQDPAADSEAVKSIRRTREMLEKFRALAKALSEV